MTPGSGTPGSGAGMPGACPGNEERLIDLVVGHLAGKEREAVLAHLERCRQCSVRVAGLSASVDDLLALAPEVEPPAGFEARVFARLRANGTSPARPSGRAGARPGAPRLRGLSGAGRRADRQAVRQAARRRWDHRVLGAAAALVLVMGAAVGGGFALGRSSGEHVAAASVMTGRLMDGAVAVGKVMVYPGRTTWLFMYLDQGRWSGSLRCEVVARDGYVMKVGDFWAGAGSAGGALAWGAKVPLPASQVREAMVVGPSGKVMAVAQLA
ncbi:MAG TPA: hypothetical protein VFN61_13310 [Acidimicrobiales bacterium]|nr:hypothetical protein [Acidimicrobiales bacterium]